MLIELFDAADQQAEFYYGEGFKTWREEIEGVEEFLQEIISKKKLSDEKTQIQGNTIIKTIKNPIKELEDTQEI